MLVMITVVLAEVDTVVELLTAVDALERFVGI
jgi:hypothetical protein